MIATLMDWLLFFLAASLKGSVILLVALLASWRMRRSSAAARHAVIAVGLGAFLLLPIAQLLVPRWTLPILPPSPAEWAMPAAMVPADESQLPALPPEADMPAPAARAAAGSESPAPEAVTAHGSAPFAVSWMQLLVFLWLAGGAIVVLRLVAGIASVWLLERRATMITDGGWLQTAHALAQRLGLTRGVTLLRGDRGTVPLTWGVLQPVVWLPADATAWDDERRSVVLAHELAHVKRRDAITQWIANITLALHWFNPLAWMAARQLRAERERACDEAVLALGTQPTVYAEHLLAMVRTIGGGGGPAAAMAMARRSQFEGRLLAILDGATGRQRMGGARLAAISGAALLITIPLAGMAPVTRSAASAADLPGISAEAGGYPAAIGPEAAEASSSAGARDEWGGRRAVATTPSNRRRTEVSAPSTVILPAPSAEARSTADAVLRDSAAAGRVLTQAASLRDSALLLDIIAAASEMSSSSDRAIILTRIAELPPLEPPVLVALLAASKGIASSTAKTSVLAAVLKHQPAVLRVATAQYLDAVESVSSSSARSSLLGPAIAAPGLTPQRVGAVLQAIGRVSSSTDRTHAISAAIREQPAVFGAAAPALFAVIDSIPSSTDRASLLSAILQRETLSEDVLVRVIRSAGRIPTSDRVHLLIAVARRGTPTGAAKTAFLEAASAVPSSTDRANVLAALLPPGANSTPAPSTSSRRNPYERHWYIASDTSSGIPRRVVLMWQGMELRNGAIADPAPRARLELEETREVPGAGKSEQRKVIVSMKNGQPVYDYCIDDETQAFDAEARSWFAATLRAAERARR